MCNQLLQHAKVIPNDQSVQPDLAYLFFIISLCNIYLFFPFKKLVSSFYFKRFYFNTFGFFSTFFQKYGPSRPPPPPPQRFCLFVIPNLSPRTMLYPSVSDIGIDIMESDGFINLIYFLTLSTVSECSCV